MPQENALLGVLSMAARSRLVSLGETVNLELKHIVYEPNVPIRHVYFPLSGVISLVNELKNGDIVEVATIGNEGMVGLPAFFGARSIPGQALSQIPGRSLRLDAAKFLKEVKAERALESVIHRYAQALFNQISWSLACLRQHSIEQRCARWLLMTYDRVDSDEYILTQEFLGQMLGVRRASVSAVASKFRAEGMIDYVRGRVTILNRKGLENRACECYGVVREEYRRLVGRSGTR